MSKVKSSIISPEIENYRGYNGNLSLKRSGVDIQWNKELISEYFKCSQDVIYFVEKYMKIVHVDRGLIPFVPYDYQRDMLLSMADNRYTIITTARQAGKCQNINTPIKLRNKKTGEILETTIGEFYAKSKQNTEKSMS